MGVCLESEIGDVWNEGYRSGIFISEGNGYSHLCVPVVRGCISFCYNSCLYHWDGTQERI